MRRGGGRCARRGKTGGGSARTRRWQWAWAWAAAGGPAGRGQGLRWPSLTSSGRPWLRCGVRWGVQVMEGVTYVHKKKLQTNALPRPDLPVLPAVVARPPSVGRDSRVSGGPCASDCPAPRLGAGVPLFWRRAPLRRRKEGRAWAKKQLGSEWAYVQWALCLSAGECLSTTGRATGDGNDVRTTITASTRLYTLLYNSSTAPHTPLRHV